MQARVDKRAPSAIDCLLCEAEVHQSSRRLVHFIFIPVVCIRVYAFPDSSPCSSSSCLASLSTLTCLLPSPRVPRQADQRKPHFERPAAVVAQNPPATLAASSRAWRLVSMATGRRRRVVEADVRHRGRPHRLLRHPSTLTLPRPPSLLARYGRARRCRRPNLGCGGAALGVFSGVH